MQLVDRGSKRELAVCYAQCLQLCDHSIQEAESIALNHAVLSEQTLSRARGIGTCTGLLLPACDFMFGCIYVSSTGNGICFKDAAFSRLVSPQTELKPKSLRTQPWHMNGKIIAPLLSRYEGCYEPKYGHGGMVSGDRKYASLMYPRRAHSRPRALGPRKDKDAGLAHVPMVGHFFLLSVACRSFLRMRRSLRRTRSRISLRLSPRTVVPSLRVASVFGSSSMMGSSWPALLAPP